MNGPRMITIGTILALWTTACLALGLLVGRRHASDCMIWTPKSASDVRSGERSIAPLACPTYTTVCDANLCRAVCVEKLPTDAQLKAWLETDPRRQ
jgi:hypothetical protein